MIGKLARKLTFITLTSYVLIIGTYFFYSFSFALLGENCSTETDSRVASCLGWDDYYSHALMTQYRSVPAAVMGCNLE